MTAGVVTQAVCCAFSTQAAYHAATGISLARLPVIPNGVDLRRFRPSSTERTGARRELGTPDSAPAIVLSVRFNPAKDVPLFLAAARQFVRARPDAHLVLCGAGMTTDNLELTSWLTNALRGWDQAQSQVHLLGIREDMPRLYNAADLVVLTSASEAAPLALLEGMACGAVPVTTDVGDAARIVADPHLVTTRDPAAIAEAWLAAFDRRCAHTARIHRDRHRLSDQHCVDAYAALIATHAAHRPLEAAG